MAYIPVPQQMPPQIDQMHIPDGFLNAPVAIAGYLATAVLLAIAIRQTNRNLGDRAAPLMGVIAAFIFAAQMINFPVAGGTSGHLLGGTLAAIFLGPWAAIIAMASVISVQALVFQDGGLAALGANVFNMGILTALLGYAIFTVATTALPKTPAMRIGSAFAAAWTTVVVASILTSFELAISDTSALDVALPAMVGVHLLIGLGEGLITGAAVAFVQSTQPDLLEHTNRPETIMEAR